MIMLELGTTTQQEEKSPKKWAQEPDRVCLLVSLCFQKIWATTISFFKTCPKWKPYES